MSRSNEAVAAWLLLRHPHRWAPWQKEFLKELRHNRLAALPAGRMSGRTFLAEALVITVRRVSKARSAALFRDVALAPPEAWDENARAYLFGDGILRDFEGVGLRPIDTEVIARRVDKILEPPA
jgi:hypothetical protein